MRRYTALAEWPTVGLLVATYLLWGFGTTWAATYSLPLAILLTAIAIAQFSSLQHEVLHGHPFASQKLNEALVFPGLTLFVPYGRFRDTHLAHHYDPDLTDPYDDPESNYHDPAVWAAMPDWLRVVLNFNNTLLGRLMVGPVVGTWHFIATDVRAARKGDRRVSVAWALHGLGLVMVLLWFLLVAAMPFWAYLLAVYLGFSILKIRTFLEHRAHEAARARTVVIEDRGPLALLFLNNNYHVVHHMHPQVPWYKLPQTYREHRDHYLRRNEGYVYRSYAEIFGRYFLRAKDPVPHPLWPKGDYAETLEDTEGAKPLGMPAE
ncbi:MAG: fatty acid desaturase [Cereibacter sphaeroides]|uniref:Fatty acid desaturase n=1 Tax=Cereibacter sphaeroides TaxID=1063 RepID=A0A2W5SB24_CERSP|nr:MAG: fatty acid desaturase [Cereibacter sphaeroides]